jgi:LysR family transcriptional activator of nhaA
MTREGRRKHGLRRRAIGSDRKNPVQNVNYNRLYYFHVVATAGSQAAASRRLQISQSTISEQIKQLENTLATALFERGGGRMHLTDAGRKCLEFTETMFSAAERLLQMFSIRSAERIVLEVAVASSVARSFATESFLPLLDDPELVPRIRHGQYSQLMQDLRARELDIVLADGKPTGRLAEGIASVPAARLNFVLVAHPQRAAELPRIPADLVAEPFLGYPDGSTYRIAIDEFFRRHAMVPNIVMETDDIDLLRLAARRGRGVAALPERLVRRDVARGTLALLGPLDLDMHLYLNHLEGKPTETVQRALDILTHGFGRD